jgi:DNA-binding SARP family transcriptional activator/TolB-like protein
LIEDSPEPRPRKEDRDGWSLQLFGGVAFSYGGRTVSLRNRKSQAILGYVTLSPSRRATREQLAGLLWSESSEFQARASLRQALRGLRQVLDTEGIQGVVVGRDEISITSDSIAVDVWNVLSGAEKGELAQLLLERKNICETLLQALDDLDPAFRSWLLVQRQSLHERLVFMLEAQLEKASGEESPGNRLAKAISLVLLNLDPTHEGACRRLMLASVTEGDIAGALRRYNTLWDLLDNEYDVEPSEETQRLVASIKIGSIPAARRETPAFRAAEPPPAAETRGGAQAAIPGERGDRRLRIMVGPFDATGVDPEQRYLVSGFRHQLISSLIRFREWSLIDGTSAPIFAAGAQLATYVVTASAYQAHSQIQLVLTLSDVMTGEYVWSEDVSAELATWFSTQKLVVRRLAIALNVHLSADRLDRTLDRPDVSLALYDRWLRGEALTQRWRGRNRLEAADIFRSIITEAPNFAPAYCSVVNFTNSRSHIFPGELRTETLKQEAMELARVAVQLDPTYSRTHLCSAWSYALNGHFDQAELGFQMAYDLNENDPWTIISSSLGLAFCGHKELAAQRADLALQLGLCLEPRHWGYQAVIRFLCEDYQGCVAAADQAQDAIYNFAAWRAAALTQLGQHERARTEWGRFVDMVSGDWHGDGPPDHDAITRWLLQGFPIKSAADWKRLRDGILATEAPAAAVGY